MAECEHCNRSPAEDDPDVILDRLAAGFGEADIAVMIGQLAEGLRESLEALDNGDTSSAHRLAGVAGTLGFATAGRAWLALSEGRDEAATEVRRESERALAIIARRLGKSFDPATSV